jgi:uncharacterized protein with PIN domain
LSDHRFVLDSYAILALLNNEAGATRVASLLNQAKDQEINLHMSLINLGEVAYIVERRHGQEKVRTMLAYLENVGILYEEASKERILAAAHLKARFSIAYADAFAAALAGEYSATLLTGNPEFRASSTVLHVEWLG